MASPFLVSTPISQDTNDADHLFMCLFAYDVFFAEVTMQIGHPFINWVVYFFIEL